MGKMLHHESHHHGSHHDSHESPEWDMIKHGKNPNLPPNHPVNALSPLRKAAILGALAYAGMLANFSIAITQVAFKDIGDEFGVAPGDIANALGYNLLGLAVGPLFWNPLSRSLGRRPVYILGSILFIPMVVWESRAQSYASYCLARTFAGLFSAWSQTVPPATIADIFVVEVRGRKMSTFAIPVVIGPVIAPLFCAAIVYKTGQWRNVFYFNIGLAVLQLILCVLIVPETLWNEDAEAVQGQGPGSVASTREGHDGHDGHKDEHAEHSHAHAHEQHFSDKHATVHVETAAAPVSTTAPGTVGAAFAPWRDWGRFARVCAGPFVMLQYLCIDLASFYYGICFGFLSVGITVVAPQTLDRPPFSFKPIPLGCAFLAFGIGGLLGKWSGGIVGDKTVAYFERRHGSRQPEDRLWALYPMLPLMFVGCLLVGLQLQLGLHWMCLLMGGAIAFFALSGSTGILQTYTVESYVARAMDTQAVFNFWKCLWGFVTPFFCMVWGEKSGWIATYVAQGAILLGLGLIVNTLLIYKGYALRRWQGMPIMDRSRR